MTAPDLVQLDKLCISDFAKEHNFKQQFDLTPLDVYDIIRLIRDPEKPNTLEELKVLTEDYVLIPNNGYRIYVYFKPTVSHCSLANLIGLCIFARLKEELPSCFKLKILVRPGSHQFESDLNKQLADKERVAAALENENITSIIHRCIDNLE